MTLKLVRRIDQAVVASEAVVADQFMTRLKGLIGKKSMQDGEGMLFPECNNVHMWMMSIPLDLVFLKKVDSRSWSVLALRSQVRPWSPMPFVCLNADDTLELPSGTIERVGLRTGEVLCIA